MQPACRIALVVGFVTLSYTQAVAQSSDEAEKEVTKQTTRQVSDAVDRRITATEGVAPGTINLWSTTSYNRIDIGSVGGSTSLGVTPGSVAPSLPEFGINLYQAIIGADTRLGPVLLGASSALSLVRGNQGSTVSGGLTTGSTNLSGDSFTISPYAAVILTDNLFVTGLVGYTYGENTTSTGSSVFTFPGVLPLIPPSTTVLPGLHAYSNADTFFTDIAANASYPIPDTPVTLGGRGGYRYQYTWSHLGNNGGSSGFGSHTLYLAGEGRYRIDAFTPYIRVQYEYNDPLGARQPGEQNNALFLIAGIDYAVTPQFTAGIQFMDQEVTKGITNRQVALNLRARF